jgi:hypothetical protein
MVQNHIRHASPSFRRHSNAHTDSRWDTRIVKQRAVLLERGPTPLHHSRPGEAEVVLAGTAHDDVVQDTDTDILEGLSDLVGGVDVLFGRITLLSGVRLVRRRSVRQSPDQELVRRHPGAEQVAIMSKTGSK